LYINSPWNVVHDKTAENNRFVKKQFFASNIQVLATGMVVGRGQGGFASPGF